MLYLLDCCHAASAAITQGKELIAAAERSTPGSPSYSFTRYLKRALTQAAFNRAYLTGAQLWFRLVQDYYHGAVREFPIHAENQTGPFPRTSIVLTPVGEDPNPTQWPLTGANAVSLGARREDLKAVISVRIGDESQDTLNEMRTWLTTLRPPEFTGIGITFDVAWQSNSLTMIVTIPLPVFYCLPSIPGLAFVDWKASPPLPATVGPSQMKENLPFRGPKGGQGQGGQGQSGQSSGGKGQGGYARGGGGTGRAW